MADPRQHDETVRALGHTRPPKDSICLPQTEMLSALDLVAWIGPVLSGVA
jgi:hypothetical protein